LATRMTPPRKENRRFGEERKRLAAEERWREAGYDPEVVERLRWDRRYSVFWIGESAYAFSDHDGYVAALAAAWSAGFVPRHGPSFVRGIDLPEVAPSLRGVDIDLTSTDSPGLRPETR
jgi:hypothetical protein